MVFYELIDLEISCRGAVVEKLWALVRVELWHVPIFVFRRPNKPQGTQSPVGPWAPWDGGPHETEAHMGPWAPGDHGP